MTVWTLDDVFPRDARPAGDRHRAYVDRRLAESSRWGTESFAATVARHAREQPAAPAYVSTDTVMTWADYEAWSEQVAGTLLATGLPRGERIAVLHPDGPVVHAIFTGIEKAGYVIVGIGPRAGVAEVRHLVEVTGAAVLVTPPVHRGQDMAAVFERLATPGSSLRHHVTVDGPGPIALELDGEPVASPAVDNLQELVLRRRRQVGEIWLVNSTSGTTGLPKCVVHTQSRWRYFHELAVDAGQFTTDDRFMSVIPAPFGFGIWTAHTSPLLLGAVTVVAERFSPESTIELIAREQVTVLACVTTQFIMMLNSPAIDTHDLTSLRAMFTGGEAVPYTRAAEFEERTGAKVLQFYGSNETGALSYTSLRDTRRQRLETAGRAIAGMEVVLVDDDGNDVTQQGGPGQAACAGPATCLGYYADDEANAELIGPSGHMVTGDICTIDRDGYLRVVGRKSDFIIRGGKNISAVAVEEEVQTHPAVAVAAAVAMPDEVFGERVCVFVELVPGRTLTLDELRGHLEEREVSKSSWPERLELIEELPRSSGGKIAKGELRDRARKLSVLHAG